MFRLITFFRFNLAVHLADRIEDAQMAEETVAELTQPAAMHAETGESQEIERYVETLGLTEQSGMLD